MIIINFSHKLTEPQIESIKALTHFEEIERVISLPVQFDPQLPFQGQLVSLMEEIPLSLDEMQTLPIVVNLPSLNHIAAMVLAYLHGKMGHFPTIIRIRPAADSTPTQFEVAELINLQIIRDKYSSHQVQPGEKAPDEIVVL